MATMRGIFICTALVFLALGCGFNPDVPIYDTARNPEGYPEQALRLIERVEQGTLTSFDEITSSFAQLYEANPNLLDNQQWLQVVSRLGVKFRYQADQLAELGIPNYHHAAQLYQLASFARPDDERLQHRYALFTTWEEAIADSVVPLSFDPLKSPLGLPQQLRVLRYFMLTDTVSRKFAEEFLLPRLLDAHAAESALKATSGPQGLTIADKCFLTTVGFKYKGPDRVIATFGEPAIDLVAAKVTAEQSGWYGTEVYFIPREKISEDYTIAIRVKTADSTGGTGEWLPFDFHPLTPSSTWKPNEIAPAYRRFVLPRQVEQVAVGIFQATADSAHFVRVRDTGEPLFVLPPATFAGR